MGEAGATTGARARATFAWPLSSVVTLVIICSLLAAGGGPASGQPQPCSTVTMMGSPKPSASACVSPTKSATPSAAPGRSYRSVRLETRHHRVRARRAIALKGSIASLDLQCSIHQRVRIRRRIHGTGPRYRTFRRTRTNERARFSVRLRAHRSADYLAVVRAGPGCERGVSDPIQVFALVRVGVSVDDSTPARFENFRIHGSVLPRHPGTRVVLDRRSGDKWRRYRRYRAQILARGSTFSYFVEATWKGTRVFRIRWRKADHDHETNVSRSLEIRTHP